MQRVGITPKQIKIASSSQQKCNLACGRTVWLVHVFCLELSRNATRLVVLGAVDNELLQNKENNKTRVSNSSIWSRELPYRAVGGSCLDFKSDGTNRIVLCEQVLGGLSNIREGNWCHFQKRRVELF